MISNELSTIQTKDAERAIHAAAIADFERDGGAIQRIEIKAPGIDTAFEEGSFNGRFKGGRTLNGEAIRDAKVREMALTMSITSVETTTGIHHVTLAKIAKRMGFEFQRGARMPTVKTEEESDRDEALALEIIAKQAEGLNRAKAMRRIGIGYDKFHRLLKEYAIDYPVLDRSLRNKQVKD